MTEDECDVSDDQLLERVADHYRQAFARSARAVRWLAERGVDRAVADSVGVGWSDRTLGLTLPSPDRAGGRRLRARLQRLGVLRPTGHEQFRGCVVVPVRGGDGAVVQICGLRVDRPQRRSDRPTAPIDEVRWLAGPEAAVCNSHAILASDELILTGGVLEVLVWQSGGFPNVVGPAGPGGWPEDLCERFRAGGVRRALLAMPRTAAGDEHARALSATLSAVGVECFRVVFPHRCGVVEVATAADGDSAALPERIREAIWLGGAPRNDSAGPTLDAPDHAPVVVSPVPPPPRCDGIDAEGGELRLRCESRCWRVRGLDVVPTAAGGSLRVNVWVRDSEQ